MAEDRIGRRRIRVVAAVTVAAAVIAAVVIALSHPDHTSGDTVVSMAGSATTSTGSFRVTLQTRSYSSSDPSRVTLAGTESGVVDLAHHRSDITIEMTTGPGAPLTERQIAIGSDSWVSESAARFPNLMIPPKPWLHFQMTGNGHAGFLGIDPIGFLDRLKTRAAVHLIGHEIVRGVETARYEISAHSPPTTSANLQISNIREQVWVSSDHLVRRFETVVDVIQSGGAAAPGKQTQESVFEFFDFGLAANIQPPPTDQVMDVPPSRPIGPTSTTTPDLPAPNLKARSSLQFRPVQQVRQDQCASSTSNPPDAQSATLPGPEGAC
jgi:hypothetical protein